MPATQMGTGEIPSFYRRFAAAIGERHWQAAVSRQEVAIQANPFLGHYLRDEYSIAYQLDKLRQLKARLGTIPPWACNDRSIYPAMGFAAQALEIMARSRPKQAKAFVSRVRTAMADAANMHGLRLELLSATHFVRRGHRVSWARPASNGAFDLLVEDLGASGLEVECKSISENKGRRIRRRDALDFWGLLLADLQGIARDLRSGLAVVLTLPDRLPDDVQERSTLAREVVSRVLAGNGTRFGSGIDLRIDTFDPAPLKAGISSGGTEFREALTAATATANREAALYGTPAGGLLALVVQSARKDDVLNQVFATLVDSAPRQFTGTRGAMFLVALQGIDADSLLSVAGQDNDPSQPPTGLALEVSQFLSTGAPDCVIGVAFASKGSLLSTFDGSTDSGGSTYYFPKKESSKWDPSFSGLFSSDSRGHPAASLY